MKLSEKALEDFMKDNDFDGSWTSYKLMVKVVLDWLNEEVDNPRYKEGLCGCGHFGHNNTRSISRYKLYESE